MTRSLPDLVEKTRSVSRDTRGSVAVIAAVAFPVLIGGMGLGAEVGYWYLRQRELQHAADLSAYAAALRLDKGDSGEEIDAVALHIATESGFDDAVGDIEVNNPPTTGPNAGDATRVEVLLTEEIARSFSGFFGADPVDIAGRAVAVIDSVARPACLIALAATGAQTLSITGNGSITLNNCLAVANSTNGQGLYVSGSGSLTAECAHTASGGAYGQKTSSIVSTCEPEVQEGAAADPYAAVTLPTKHATCYTAGKKDPAIPVSPTKTTVDGVKIWDLCALSISSNMTLEAGMYIIHGGNVSDTGQNTVTGTGVTFYLTSKASAPTVYSRIAVNGTNFNLSAPTSGAYAGLVFVADAANTGIQSFGGNSNLQAQGALRFPGGTIDFGGGSGSGGCVQLIADKISFTGNGDITFGHACAGTGVSPATVGADATVQLSE